MRLSFSFSLFQRQQQGLGGLYVALGGRLGKELFDGLLGRFPGVLLALLGNGLLQGVPGLVLAPALLGLLEGQ